MARTPRDTYDRERDRLDDALEDGRISTAEYDAIVEFLDARDNQTTAPPCKNPGAHTSPAERDRHTVQQSDSGHSLRTYASALRNIAERLDVDLTEASAADINDLMDGLYTGDHPAAPDGGLSAKTRENQQGKVRVFFQYHDDLGVDDYERITMNRVDGEESNRADPRDMFDEDEIEALRDAVTNSRDRAILELLLNTGLRISALSMLRVRDVMPHEGETGKYRLNDSLNGDGLKGAYKPYDPRPLLGAKRACIEWLNDHPCADDPDAAFITQLPSWRETGDTLSVQSINRLLREIRDRANEDRPASKQITKPVNAHNFRHNFVTMCKKDYGMDNEYIKWLIFHAPDSTVMQTTYSHLTAEEKGRKAEEQAGFAEPDEDTSPLTPPTCTTCYEPLPEGAKACSSCGTVYTPDAKSAHDELQDDVKEDYKETDPEDTDTQELIDALDEALNDPKAKAALLEKLGEN